MPDEQLPLFDFGDSSATPARRSRRTEIGPAPVAPELAALAKDLPDGVHLGTSSWSFPGWAGIVYDQSASESMLARRGLPAYARHPLLRAAGIDRTYYAPVTTETLRAYADVVPDAFRFLIKAHERCVLPTNSGFGQRHQHDDSPNPLFLDPAYAREAMIAPIVAGLGEKAGPLVFQFPPLDLEQVGGPEVFLARLHQFLGALPREVLTAVELRNASLLTPTLFSMMAETGTALCLNVHPTMPSIAEQWRMLRNATPAPGPLVVRWMLHGRLGYQQARDRYKPFDQIVDPDKESRDAIAAMMIETVAARQRVYVIANNKAEGSAPLTIFRLAERFAERRRAT